MESIVPPAAIRRPCPSASALPMYSVPALSRVLPWKILAAASWRMLLPFLVRLPLPLITPFRLRFCWPLMVRSPLSPIGLRTVWPVLAAPRVVPAAVVRAPVPRALALPSSRVPAFSATPPWKPLLPARVRVAAPFLVRPPVPEITPLSVRPLDPATVTLPPSVMALVTVRAALASRIVPAAALNVPMPRALSRPMISLPAFSFTPPVKVLAPLRVRSAAPFLSRPLAFPLMGPLKVSALLPARINRWLLPRAMPLPRLTAAVLSRESPEAPRVRPPEPSAVLLATRSEPAVRLTPPLKWLAPVRNRAPLPVLARPPLPVMLPLRVRLLATFMLNVAPRSISVARDSAVVVCRADAPLTDRPPRPSAAALLRTRVPLLRVVPPL